jgi:hypothetical protein
MPELPSCMLRGPDCAVDLEHVATATPKSQDVSAYAVRRWERVLMNSGTELMALIRCLYLAAYLTVRSTNKQLVAKTAYRSRKQMGCLLADGATTVVPSVMAGVHWQEYRGLRFQIRDAVGECRIRSKVCILSRPALAKPTSLDVCCHLVLQDIVTPIPALISSLLVLPRMATTYLLVRSLSSFSVPSLEAVIEVRLSHVHA